MAAAPAVDSSIEFISVRVIAVLPTHPHLYIAHSLTPGLCRIGMGVVLALGHVLRAPMATDGRLTSLLMVTDGPLWLLAPALD